MEQYPQPPYGDENYNRTQQLFHDASRRTQKVLRKPVPGSQQSGIVQNVQPAGSSSRAPAVAQPAQGQHIESPLPPIPREAEALPVKQRDVDVPTPVPRGGPGQTSEKQQYVEPEPSEPFDQVAADEEFARQLEQMELEDQAPPLPGRRPIMVDTSVPGNITDSAVYASPARTDTGTTGASSQTFSSNGFSPASTGLTSPATTITSPEAQQEESKFKGFMKDAWSEARLFAGGLIEHPSESTKHHSVLRHSSGLVFYQGTTTSITISIFSDGPLPPDRTIWLQSKGWTGKAGMKMKTLVGHTGYWLNVTPQTAVTAAQLNPNDEKAWQRDIKHFYKHAEKSARKHRLRETCICRVPVEAEDGYFRLMLCSGTNKKVLCPSPVFRILSTSTSPSSIRGASLSTLPLELGAKIASVTANTMASNAISPVTGAIQGVVQPYMPSWGEQTAAQAVYGMSGAQGRVDSTVSDANSRYDSRRDLLYNPTTGEPIPDAGPQPPYPIKFTGRVEKGTGVSEDRFGMPTANLFGVPESVMLRLKGYYFGWARVNPSKRRQSTQSKSLSQTSSSSSQAATPSEALGSDASNNSNPWYEAVISCLPLDVTTLQRVKVSHTLHQTIGVYLIHDLKGSSLLGLTLEVRILGFIRPPSIPAAALPAPPTTKDTPLQPQQTPEDAAAAIAEQEMLAAVNDVSFAEACLARPAWGPDPLKPLTERTQSGIDRLKDGYASSRMYAQKQMDKVPLHRAGVRMPVDGMRSRAVEGTGGIYVVR